ncbi:MAG: Crp/Fnr family transcriptional regulator [Bacteroidota bacterium]
MKERHIKKGQLLVNKGDVSNKVFLVQEGLLRSYSIDDKGKEHIFMFAPKGWVIADYNHFDAPSQLFIDAIEDSVVVQVDKQSAIEHDVPKLIRRIQVLQNRVIMLMSATAIERYEHFVETYPDIVQRVPQKMIASYLGITPEALSTVKRQRLRKK